MLKSKKVLIVHPDEDATSVLTIFFKELPIDYHGGVAFRQSVRHVMAHLHVKGFQPQKYHQ